MLSTKKLKKVTVTIAASLLVTLSLPTGVSHAATQGTADAVSPTSLLNSIFKQVGLNWYGNGQSTVTTNNLPDYSEDYVKSSPAPTQAQAPTAPVSNQGQTANYTLADKIIKTGEKYLGTPYKFGARSGQTNVFDCSSFVQYVYGVNGIKLPRSSRQQATVGTTIPRSQIQKGDLLFFKTSHSNGRIGHVGIYAGNNKVLHTWGPGGVRYDSLSTPWLDKGFVLAKRVIK
jgi:cell wall-associated NlpC family hydrolase